LNGFDYVLISRASAKIAVEGAPDFFFGWRGIACQELVRAHDHSGCAVSALQPVLFPEALLQWVKPAVFGHSFDCDNLRTVRLNREHRARLHRQTIRQYCARAADACLATNVRSGQTRDIADEVREQKTWLNVLLVRLAIYCNFHVHTRFSLDLGERRVLYANHERFLKNV
jgi:hypothetical protein